MWNKKRMTTVLFRADASSQIGSGHIMRTLVLADELRSIGFDIIYLTRNLEGNLNTKIKNNNFKAIDLQTDLSSEIISYIKKTNAQMIVFDHYDIDYKQEKEIKYQTGIIVFSFDDMIHMHYCDFLLNQNIFSKAEDYKTKTPQHCKLFLGSDYALMRKEFFDIQKRKRNIINNKINIFVFLGGADPDNVTLKTLQALSILNNISFSVTLVIGSSNSDLDQINSFIKQSNLEITLHIDVSNIAELMNSADLAITAGGSTTLELIQMQLPSLTIILATNQEKISYMMDEKNYSKCIGWHHQLSIEDFKNKIEHFIHFEWDKFYNILKNKKYNNSVQNMIKTIEKSLLKIAVVTDKKSWINQYISHFIKEVKNKYLIKIDWKHNHLECINHDILFILSYTNIIKDLSLNKHHIIVHESDLPQGKGMSPLTWQILEGKNDIPITLFEADKGIDSGNYYCKDFIHYHGYELIDELREQQAKKTFELCLKYIEDYPNNQAIKQSGKESFYQKRTPKNSELDINKTIKEQFDLLRVVDNDKYPAFFEIDGHKYLLHIERSNDCNSNH